MEILDLRANGSRLVDVCDYLTARAIPTPCGGSRWAPNYITRLLQTDAALDLAEEWGYLKPF